VVFETGKTVKTLEKALDNQLSEEEVKEVRDFLVTTQSLGKIGKFIIWLVITFGALVTVFHQLQLEIAKF